MSGSGSLFRSLAPTENEDHGNGSGGAGRPPVVGHMNPLELKAGSGKRNKFQLHDDKGKPVYSPQAFVASHSSKAHASISSRLNLSGNLSPVISKKPGGLRGIGKDGDVSHSRVALQTTKVSSSGLSDKKGVDKVGDRTQKQKQKQRSGILPPMFSPVKLPSKLEGQEKKGQLLSTQKIVTASQRARKLKGQVEPLPVFPSLVTPVQASRDNLGTLQSQQNIDVLDEERDDNEFDQIGGMGVGENGIVSGTGGAINIDNDSDVNMAGASLTAGGGGDELSGPAGVSRKHPRAERAERGIKDASLSLAKKRTKNASTMLTSIVEPSVYIESIRKTPTQSIEFVYLTYRNQSSYNPYDLVIVPHAQVNRNDFFTMSCSGVTHFVWGVAEFTSLDQWEREAILYKKIMKIRLFKKYKMWKMYSTWRSNVRSKKMNETRSFLRTNLFMLHPRLSPGLLKIREIALKMSQMRLNSISQDLTYTVEEFMDAQELEEKSFLESVAKIYRDIRSLIQNACEDSLKIAGFGGTAEQDSYANYRTWGTGGELVGTQSLHYAEQAARRNECRRLTCYIKMMDYLLTDTLHSVIVGTVVDFLEIINNVAAALEKKEKEEKLLGESGEQSAENALSDSKDSDSSGKAGANRGNRMAASDGTNIFPKLDIGGQFKMEDKAKALFHIYLTLKDNKLCFSPTSEKFDSCLQKVVNGYVDTVLSVEKLILHEDFRHYTEYAMDERIEALGEIPEGLDLRVILDDNLEYRCILSEIQKKFAQAYEKCDAYSENFVHFKDVYLKNSQMNISQFSEEDFTLDFFKSSIDQFMKQISEMSQMATMAQVYVVAVDTHGLKELFLPSPRRCLEEINSFIPKLAHHKNQALIARLNNATRTLSIEPETVEDFVNHLNFLQEINTQQSELQDSYKGLTEMYEMMEEYNVKVPDEEYATYQTLKPAYHTLKDVVATSEMNKDQKMDKFIQELDKLISSLKTSMLEIHFQAQHSLVSNPDYAPEEVLAYIQNLLDKVEKQKVLATNYARYQEIFKVPVSRYEELEETYNDLNLKLLLWKSLTEWIEKRENWNNSAFEDIDADETAAMVKKYSKFYDQVERGLQGNKVVLKFKQLVDEFKQILPVVLYMRNPALKPRHWERIQEVIQTRLVRDKNFTLGMLLELKITAYKEHIAAISLEATKEAMLEQMLQKVESVWSQIDYATIAHKDSYIIGGIDDIITQLEDSQFTIGTIKASRYVGPIKHEVDEWDRQLSLMADTLEEWVSCQRNWIYLESIFSAADIQRQLPNEYKLFLQVDKSWKEIMRSTKDNPNALQSSTTPGLLKTFQRSNESLEKIHKFLEDFLETKRLAFPRFYFLSNDEVLEILAHSKNPHAIEGHIRKCFDNIYSLEFAPELKSLDIQAMVSAEGERIPLQTAGTQQLKARGAVENWLGAVEASMKLTLQKSMKNALMAYEKISRHIWVSDHAAQLILVVAQTIWCREISRCLSSLDPITELIAYRDVQVEQLNKLVELVRGKLSYVQRGMLTGLITLDVHARDITTDLINQKVCSLGDFEWTKQLRYYFVDDQIVVRQATSEFQYGYEYLGCQSRLVITPLTDRCFLTLTTAHNLKMGGAPAGPAGTGKTETVKDLAKSLAKQCVVFNCSDALDFTMMGKFFSGLAQAGAWCCFDEFNRIDIEVLSVIAQQLLTIRKALMANLVKFIFEGREIKLNPSCGFFITMNPGYAGRTELPDNLSSLFRPVSMMIPDYGLIAEIILFSEGFKSAKALSQKMVQLYKLSSEQLSQQDHYDFGMRALKSVLVMAGASKRASPDLEEDTVLIRSLRDSNIPKFTKEDIPLFLGILSDLFPGVDLTDRDYSVLEKAIRISYESNNLVPYDELTKKIIQFHETMIVRHGVMLVGATGGGKTTCYKVLKDAYGILVQEPDHSSEYCRVETHILNPKSVNCGELYGEFNELTQEWKDGLVATLVRHAVFDPIKDSYKWIIFDGR